MYFRQLGAYESVSQSSARGVPDAQTRSPVVAQALRTRSDMAKPRKNNLDQGSADIGAPQNAGDTTAAMPERDRIAHRAYELYLARGAGDGEAMDDWLTAERELNQDAGSSNES